MQLHLKIGEQETVVDLGNVMMPQNGLQELAQCAARYAVNTWAQEEVPAINVVNPKVARQAMAQRAKAAEEATPAEEYTIHAE